MLFRHQVSATNFSLFFYVTFIRQKTFRPLRNGFLSGWWELLYLGDLARNSSVKHRWWTHIPHPKILPCWKCGWWNFTEFFLLMIFYMINLLTLVFFVSKTPSSCWWLIMEGGGELLSDNSDNKPYCLVKRNAGKTTWGLKNLFLEPQGQPFIIGCFHWMISNLYIGNGWKSPFPSTLNWLFGVPGWDLFRRDGRVSHLNGLTVGSFIACSPTSGSPEARDFYGFQETS